MNDFPFSLAVGQVLPITMQGNYMAFAECTAGPQFATLRVQAESGGYTFRLKPGQSIRLPESSNGFKISNADAVNTIDGVLKVGGSGSDFNDNRITGDVSIIDGGRSRTLVNQAFMGVASCPAVAAQFSQSQLWNPPASGKRIVVKSIAVGSTAAQQVILRTAVAPLANANGFCKSKLSGGADGVCQIRYENNAAPSGVNQLDITYMVANDSKLRPFTEPLVLLEGAGLNVAGGTVNVAQVAIFETVEEGIST